MRSVVKLAMSLQTVVVAARNCRNALQRCKTPLDVGYTRLNYEDVMEKIRTTDVRVTCGYVRTRSTCNENVCR